MSAPLGGPTPYRIVLFAHGSRDPDWAEPFEEIRTAAARALGDDRVRLAFLEFMSPELIECVREAALDGIPLLQVVPLFFGEGRHVRADLPALAREARRRHPEVAIRISGSLAEDEGLRKALLARVIGIAAEVEGEGATGGKKVERPDSEPF